jgi:hypothetical protein
VSDFEIRRLERIYRAAPSIESADRLINALMRSSNVQKESSEFPDLNACEFDVYDLPMFDEFEAAGEDYALTEDYQILTEWIERHASFSTDDMYHWEHMLYLGNLDALTDKDIVESFRRWVDDPIPDVLIPVVIRARKHGVVYLSFHAG